MSHLASSSLEPRTHFHGHEERTARLPETRRRPRRRGGAGRHEADGRRIGGRRAGDTGREADRDGPRRIRRRRGQGVGTFRQLAAHRRRGAEGRLRHSRGSLRVGPSHGQGAGQTRADVLYPRRSRLRAHVRDRGPRPGLYRHPLGVARPGPPRRDAQRQARRHPRSPPRSRWTNAGSSSRPPSRPASTVA